MIILITGATGFIGSRLTAHLSKLGHSIIATGRKSKPDQIDTEKITWKYGNLSDHHFCDKITKDVDIIIHCAGKAGTWGSYQSYYNANVIATKNIISSSKNNKVKKFIFLSSPSIYFDFKDQINIKEDFLPKKFSNNYAKTKYLSERLVLDSHSNSFQTLAFRPRLVLGAGDNNVLPRLIELQKSKSLYQIGSGQNIVSVTSIQNLLDIITESLVLPFNKMGKVYNIANDSCVNFWELVDYVLRSVGLLTTKKVLPLYLLLPLAKASMILYKVFRLKNEPKLQDIPIAMLAQNMTLDITKAKKELNYAPSQSWQEAVDEFSHWWLDQK
jgi:nucleoside-diphosphate-sugar epimerase